MVLWFEISFIMRHNLKKAILIIFPDLENSRHVTGDLTRVISKIFHCHFDAEAKRSDHIFTTPVCPELCEYIEHIYMYI